MNTLRSPLRIYTEALIAELVEMRSKVTTKADKQAFNELVARIDRHNTELAVEHEGSIQRTWEFFEL